MQANVAVTLLTGFPLLLDMHQPDHVGIQRAVSVLHSLLMSLYQLIVSFVTYKD